MAGLGETRFNCQPEIGALGPPESLDTAGGESPSPVSCKQGVAYEITGKREGPIQDIPAHLRLAAGHGRS